MLKWSSLQSLPTVILPTVGVEYSQLHCDWHGINELCPFPLHLSWTEGHKLQPWRIHAALILNITARGNVGNPASYLGGRVISPTYPYWPQWLHRNRKVSISAYYYTRTSHRQHRRWIMSILIPGAGRPCLFLLISNICGTSVAGGGWCWQRLAHTFPWQQYSWRARCQTAHTWLINTNNETANTNNVGADRN